MRVFLAVLTCLACGTGVAPAATLQVDTSARALQPGEVVRLTVHTGEPMDAVHVRVFDRDIPTVQVAPDTWEALVGIDLDVRAGVYEVSIEGVAPRQHHASSLRLAVTPHAFRTRVLKVDEGFVNPSPAALARINAEAADLAALWTQSTPQRLWSGAFMRPVEAPANGAFGSRSVFNGERRQPHGGADFLSPTGTPILTPNGGRVLLARDLFFTGNTVVIDHGQGLFSLFAHLSVVNVKVGDLLQQGEAIGLVGATGRVTGPHLHWAVRLNDARVDPLSLLAAFARTR
jgi:murein DD-endopeptidase MepM/ murein hydrolase activator NlpD